MANKKTDKPDVLIPGLRKRPNGSYEYRWKQGEARYSVYGSSAEECLLKAMEKKDKISQGIEERKPQNITVEKWVYKWLEDRELRLSSSSMRTYKKLIRRLCDQNVGRPQKRFGDIKLAKMDADDVRNLQKALLDSGLSTRTVNDTIFLLGHAVKQAVNEDYIDKNRVKAVEPLRRTEERARDTVHRYLDQKEIDSFLKAAEGTWYYNLYVLLLNTGLRVGEAAAFTASDIHKDSEGSPVVEINKTVTRTEYGYEIAEQTKTAAGTRTVVLSPEALKAISDQKAQNSLCFEQSKVVRIDEKPQPIFKMPKGGVIRPDRVNTEIAKICKKAKIEKFTCHAFRATYTSRLIAAGVDVPALMEQLGHKDVEMTLGLYGHADKAKKRQQLGGEQAI